MSKIVDDQIIHPLSIMNLQLNEVYPRTLSWMGFWLEHVIIEMGDKPEDDLILVRSCRVNSRIGEMIGNKNNAPTEYFLEARNLCQFYRGRPLEVKDLAKPGVHGDQSYEWIEYVDYPDAYHYPWDPYKPSKK